MRKQHRKIFRAAGCIHDWLHRRRASSEVLQLPVTNWQSLDRMTRQFEQANRCGWLSAAARLRMSYMRELGCCQRRLAVLEQHFQNQHLHRAIPTQAELAREILALQKEFPAVSCELKAGALRVETDPVVLRNIGLGAFEIRLDWNAPPNSTPYRIVALNPNPAACNESVTHPHVQDEHLCEGEGGMAIKAAIDEGRLFDFFLIVSRLLATYGEGSAYVELDNWHGVPCSDCGSSMSEDDRSSCYQCDDTLCDSCLNSCQACSFSFCAHCTGTCAACGEDHCEECLERCRQCRAAICGTCITDGLCRSCDAEQPRSADDEEDSEQTAENQPATAI